MVIPVFIDRDLHSFTYREFQFLIVCFWPGSEPKYHQTDKEGGEGLQKASEFRLLSMHWEEGEGWSAECPRGSVDTHTARPEEHEPHKPR